MMNFCPEGIVSTFGVEAGETGPGVDWAAPAVAKSVTANNTIEPAHIVRFIAITPNTNWTTR